MQRHSPEEDASGGEAPYAHYLGREVAFAQEVLDERLWAFMKDVLESLAHDRFVTVRAGRKSSKTEIAAIAALTWLYTRRGIVLTSAPGGRQVRRQVWERISMILARARRRHVLPGKMGTTSLEIGPEHYAMGLATDDPSRQQGWHAGVVVPDDPDRELTEADLKVLAAKTDGGEARSMLIIIDEASGYDESLWNAIEGSLSGSNVYVLMLANPTRPYGDEHFFGRTFRSGSGYKRIRVSAIAPKDDEIDEVPYDVCYVTPKWLLATEFVDRARKNWKVGSPMWAAYVCGRFPSVSLEQVFVSTATIASAEIAYAAGRDVDWSLDRRPGRHIGVDVARSGNDECVASLVVSGVLAAQHSWRSTDLMTSAGMVAKLMRDWGENGRAIEARNVHVDSIGLGAGVVDRLRQMGLRVDAVDVGAKPVGDWKRLVGETDFANRKAELFWVVRRAMEEGLAVIPEKYADTRRQATWCRYEIVGRSGGSVVAVHHEDGKEELRGRYGRSPDHWESFMLAFSRGSSAGVPGYTVLGASSGRRGRIARLLGR
jgi:hypothetical protein